MFSTKSGARVRLPARLELSMDGTMELTDRILCLIIDVTKCLVNTTKFLLHDNAQIHLPTSRLGL